MLLDIRKLCDSLTAPQQQSCVIDLTKEDFQGYCVSKPFEVKLVLVPENAGMQLSIEAKVIVNTQCARCLDDIEKEFFISRSFALGEGETLKDAEDLPFTPDGKLDIKELVYFELMYEVPTVLLCNESCKGLCPVCGRKKLSECDCKIDNTDPRLSVLKQLLS